MRSSRATRQGEVLNGVYELDELLRTQDSHEIYVATERTEGRRVRVKVLRAEFALRGAAVDDFLRAARTLQKLVHTSLPSVRVESDDTGIPFVVEEAVEGRPLDELLLGFPQGVPLGLATHILLPLVEALALAHEQGVVHGTIDSKRVCWTGSPTAPVPLWLELGEAHADRRESDAAYRAPELAQGGSATQRADVFAVGVLAYRMLSGELPFRAADHRALPLDEVAPQLPVAWTKLTGACLEVDPRRRYRDAGVLLELMRTCARESSSWPSFDRPLARSSAPNSGAYREHKAPASLRARSQRARSVPALDGREAREANTGASSAPPRSSRPEVTPVVFAAPPRSSRPEVSAKAIAPAPRTLRAEFTPAATVAAAFAPLEEEPVQRPGVESKPAPTANERTSRAREIASKLSSKPPARDREPAQRRASSRPAAAQRAFASPPPRANSRPPNSRPDDRRRTQSQMAAAAFTELQLEALRALRPQHEDDDDDDRWVALFSLLFLALLLQLALPLLYETQMVRARALFGSKLQLVGAGFTVAVVIATVRVWAARVQSSSLLVRGAGFSMLVIATCVSGLYATQFTGSAGAAGFAGFARNTLPWAMSILFFLFAFGGLLRGLRSVSNDAFYGLMVMLLAAGCLYGSYRAVFSTVLARKHDPAAPLAREHDPAAATVQLHEPGKPTQPGSDPAASTDERDRPAIDAMEQRHEVGADEAEDLKSGNDLGATRTRSQTVLRKALETTPH